MDDKVDHSALVESLDNNKKAFEKNKRNNQLINQLIDKDLYYGENKHVTNSGNRRRYVGTPGD